MTIAHKGFKSFEVGDQVTRHLNKEHYLKSTYNKLNLKKRNPCKIQRKFGNTS